MGKWMQSVLNHPGGRYTLLLLAGVIVGLVSYRAFAERPLWAYFTLIVIGLVPLALFITNRRVVHLYGLAVIAALLAGVYFLDYVQETDQEAVIRISYELLRATERADYAVFDRYLARDYRWQSMNKDAMMARVRTSLVPSESRSCSLSSAQARPRGTPNEYSVEGNLSAHGRFGNQDGFFTGTIELQYRKQPDGNFQVVGTRVAWVNGGEVTLPPR